MVGTNNLEILEADQADLPSPEISTDLGTRCGHVYWFVVNYKPSQEYELINHFHLRTTAISAVPHCTHSAIRKNYIKKGKITRENNKWTTN